MALLSELEITGNQVVDWLSNSNHELIDLFGWLLTNLFRDDHILAVVISIPAVHAGLGEDASLS